MINIMDNLEIAKEIAKEIERLEATYQNYKILYRKLMFCCCSNERKTVKAKRDQYKLKLREMIDLQCQNV